MFSEFITTSTAATIIGIIAIILALKFIKHVVKWIITGIVILAVVLTIIFSYNDMTIDMYEYHDYPAMYRVQT